MAGIASNRLPGPLFERDVATLPRAQAKRARILEAATQHFAEHGFQAVRVGDIAAAVGIAKGSIFQHFGSKNGLFVEVYRRALRSFPAYLDAPPEVRQSGFFEVLRYCLMRTERLLHENWVPYRIALVGNYGTDLALKREINHFLTVEDPYGTLHFVRFGLERGELRNDLDVEMMVSILDWTMERFQDGLLAEELDPGLFRRQGEPAERKEARIQQLVAVLQRAIGAAPVGLVRKPGEEVRKNRRR